MPVKGVTISKILLRGFTLSLHCFLPHIGEKSSQRENARSCSPVFNMIVKGVCKNGGCEMGDIG